MPYTKFCQTKEPPMTRLLRSYKFNGTSLGRLLGVSHGTGQKKLTDPDNLTIGDLRRISKAGHIPMDELRGAIV